MNSSNLWPMALMLPRLALDFDRNGHFGNAGFFASGVHLRHATVRSCLITADEDGEILILLPGGR
jgi:hypothetical protein